MEWTGAKPCRWNGGRKHIEVPQDYRVGEEALTTQGKTGLETVGGKRHFQPRYSEVAPDWKPCCRMSKPLFKSRSVAKITELPCPIKPPEFRKDPHPKLILPQVTRRKTAPNKKQWWDQYLAEKETTEKLEVEALTHWEAQHLT